MTKTTLIIAFFGLTNWGGVIYAQEEENTVPDAGNVGIGTTNPQATLDVNGTVSIDSTLVVKDSVTIQSDLRVEEDAHFMNKTEMKDADVNELFRANGESEFNGNVRFTNLSNQNGLTNSHFLTLDALGAASRVPFDSVANVLKGIVHGSFPPDWEQLNFCGILQDSPYSLQPYWIGKPNKVIIPCPNINVGIGTQNPLVKLDVRGTTYMQRLAINVDPLALGTRYFHMKVTETHPSYANASIFLIENNNRPLFQINNDGIVRSREIKVNLDAAWPDYVFKPNYALLPLNEVKQFIDENGHLPNVPSAKEIEEDGISLGEMNRVLLEKVEELTLHLIEQQKLLEEQAKRIEVLENNK